MTHDCATFLEPSLELGAGEPALKLAADLGVWVLPVFGLDTQHPSGCRCRDKPLPCRRPAKHPRIKRGYHAASRDATQIRAWWARWQRVSNLGVALDKSSLLVLDLDVSMRHERLADGSLRLVEVSGVEILNRWLTERNVTLPKPRWTVATPGGGFQLYFRRPRAWLPSRDVRALPCVDVLSDGYVVTAPGWRLIAGDVREYVGITCPCQVPELPAQVAELLAGEVMASRARHQNEQQASPGDGDVDVERMRRAGIPMGEQDIQLWRMACSLAFHGLAEAQISTILWEACESSARAGEIDSRWPWTMRDVAEKSRRAVAKAREQQAAQIPWPGLTNAMLARAGSPRGA